MPDRVFHPGFRLSSVDVGILLIGGLCTAWSATLDRWLAMGVVFVLVHFFVFCNVLRLPRRLELAWAGVFCVLASGAGCGLVAWPIIFGVSGALTVLVATLGIRLPSYHGAGWRRINPGLPQWWDATTAAKSPGG